MTTPTPTQIRTAILRAAHHIEGNPKLYDFNASEVPDEDGNCPACMWGWVGWFLGMYRGLNAEVAEECGHKSTSGLYKVLGSGVCALDIQTAARCLRTFADKYHPETETYPEVQAELERIFAGEVAA